MGSSGSQENLPGGQRGELVANTHPRGSKALLMGVSIPATVLPRAGVWQPPRMLTAALGSDSGGNKLVFLCESTEAKNGPFQSHWLFPVSCPQACPHSHQGLQHSRSEVYRGRSTNSKGHLEEITKRVNPVFPLPSQTHMFLPIDWPLLSPHISPV